MKAVLPLRYRLALLVLVAALPLIALVVFNIVNHARLESEQAAEAALHSARAVDEKTGQSLQRARALLAWMTKRPSESLLHATHCDPVFSAFGASASAPAAPTDQARARRRYHPETCRITSHG